MRGMRKLYDSKNHSNASSPRAAVVPFSIGRNKAGSLSEQMAYGIRQAIASRFYKPGDVLPTILEWSKLLNVSIRVPEAAVAALVRDGLITAQKGVGCIVNAQRQDVWRGRVLVIMPDGDYVYYLNMLTGRLRTLLTKAGYLYTQVTVPQESHRVYDLRQLGHEVEMRPDFTLLLNSSSSIERRLSKSGVRFGVYGKKRCGLQGCVTNMRCDVESSVAKFVRHCKKAGVKSVLQVSKTTGGYFDAVPELREVGILADEWRVEPWPGCGRTESVQRGALAAFRDRFAKEGRRWLPDLLVFTDDYLASGALPAMLMAGVGIPRDVKVVSLANAGHGPVYPMPITRIEVDPLAHGEAIAETLLAVLDGRKPRRRNTITSEYVVGDTFPLRKCTKTTTTKGMAL